MSDKTSSVAEIFFQFSFFYNYLILKFVFEYNIQFLIMFHKTYKKTEIRLASLINEINNRI